MKQKLFRYGYYLLGMAILAFGITLTAKANWGASPLVSVSYVFSDLTGYSYGVLVFIQYALYVVVEFLLYGKHSRAIDALQFVIALLFSTLLGVTDKYIPAAPEDNIPVQLLIMLLGIFLTGIGLSITITLNMLPNPADGLVNALAYKTKKSTGLCKNVLDISHICLSIALGLIFAHRLIAVGIGTVLAALLTGRVVALYFKFCVAKTRQWAGLEPLETV